MRVLQTKPKEKLTLRPEEIQRRHYAATALHYDEDFGETPEHELAMYILLGILDSLNTDSVLDVGAGTGRALKFFSARRPHLTVHGIEPVEELRNVGHANGIPRDCLTEGSGEALPFPDNSFDVVTEFGILHHVRRPHLVVREMLRVARFAVFISDTNNLGQGRFAGRLIKNLFYWLGLWNVLNFIRTRGRGSVYEANDGLWYYYTPFLHFGELRRECHSVHILNTRQTSRTHWFSASHVAILATKPAVLGLNPLFAWLK
jgi:ubiquinone/menaquinone biosynthesis C-methylase UbiE